MARKSKLNVGIIGLGIIGSRVAVNLRKAGLQVYVWNRSPKPAPNFLASPAEVAGICDVIQLFVADATALFAIIDALSGVLSARHTVVCSATIGARATVEAAGLVEATGAKFLDAPFTGSKVAAENGQLVYYTGGSDAAYTAAEPVLQAASKAIVRIGGVGDAATVKIATNMLVAVTTQTLAEACAIVRKSGIDPSVMTRALEHHGVRSSVLDMKLPAILDANHEPHFSVKHMFKDAQLAIQAANNFDIDLPATTATAGALYAALNQGWADLDFSAVAKFYEEAKPEPVPEPIVEELPPEPVASIAGRVKTPEPVTPPPPLMKQEPVVAVETQITQIIVEEITTPLPALEATPYEPVESVEPFVAPIANDPPIAEDVPIASVLPVMEEPETTIEEPMVEAFAPIPQEPEPPQFQEEPAAPAIPPVPPDANAKGKTVRIEVPASQAPPIPVKRPLPPIKEKKATHWFGAGRKK